MCEALQQALAMPLDERKRRHEINMAALRKNDLGVWRDSFLRDLRSVPLAGAAHA
jgi:trehalose 6-phosphate synthase